MSTLARLLLKGLIALALIQVVHQPGSTTEMVRNCKLSIAHAGLLVAQAMI